MTTTSGSMMALGEFRFSVNTAAFQELRRVSQYNWQSQNVVGSNPVLQFTGAGEQTITLPGVIYPEYKGGLGQLDTMRALAGKGEPLIMMDGLGRNMGKWVIVTVEETQTRFIESGIPLKQQFTLSLKYYGKSG
ncbi:phage tail protein [Emcibacter sp.]|uniref:phage tail protein n=1 Tax=Emcibacter sp. TaxID=1979954 RepID=UPI002AA907ED|nr:phage tail protein [Emcibacter sp.]